MSIVIAVLEPSNRVLIYGDKRAVTTFPDGRKITYDTYIKVHVINDKLACGITGDADWGELLVVNIKRLEKLNFNEITTLIKDYPKSRKPLTTSTITLTGINSYGKLFIWTYRTSGEITFIENKFQYTIGSNDITVMDKCGVMLVNEIKKTGKVPQSIEKAIQFASKLSPSTISPTFDRIIIKHKS